MMRIAASGHGQSRLRFLRIVRRGDRHDPKDLTVSCRYEGDFSAAFTDGHADGLVPGEALTNLVHAVAKSEGAGEIELLALSVAARLLAAFPRMTRVRVEIAEQPWARLEIGGKAQGQSFESRSGERRTTAVTSNGSHIAVVSGIEHLALMRSGGLRNPRAEDDGSGLEDGVPGLVLGTLSARWTYSSPEVTFGSYRQGVRAAIIETFAAHARLSIEHTLHAIAEVALASYPDLVDITLTMHQRRAHPPDLLRTAADGPDDLFLLSDDPVTVVDVTLQR